MDSKVKAKGFWLIVRPHLALMTLTLAAVVSLLAQFSVFGVFPDVLVFVMTVIAAYCAVVGSYVFNDVCDVDIDAVNFPDRAIPSCSLTVREAFGFSVLLYVFSLVIFLFLSLYSFVVVLCAISIITVYSWYWKRKTCFSFIPVGVSYGLVPLGVWLVFSSEITLVPVLFGVMICVSDWGFTNSDASRDVVADKKKGAPTFPVTYGVSATTRLIFVCWVVGVLLSVCIGFFAQLSFLYFFVACGAGVWVLWKSVVFMRDPRPEMGGRFFLQASKYRAVLFFVMIVDVVLLLLDVRVQFGL